MAALIGKDGIHHVAGLCELCGEPADASTEELNALTCTFTQCDANIYHQDCLEKYLKRSGCEKNRKTGFPCPRGRGKTKGVDQCPGRIDKSHPIHPRKEDKVKKAKAVEPQPVVKKYGPEAKEARKKQQKEAEKRLAEQRLKAEEEARRAKAKAMPMVKGAKPKNGAIDTKKAQQAQAAESIRRELSGQPPTKEPVKAAPRELYTLDDYEARKQPAAAPAPAYRPAQPASNAWNAKPQAGPAEGDKANLTSSAFPTIPGSKGAPAKPPQPAPGGAQRNWKASLAAQPPEPSTEPLLTTLAAPLPRQPPPPPPRDDGARAGSIGSSQAFPAIASSKQSGPHRQSTIRSSHSSQASSGSFVSGAAQSTAHHASAVFDTASQASVAASVQHGSIPSLDGFAPATAAQQEAVAQAMLQQQAMQQRTKPSCLVHDPLNGRPKRQACMKKERESDEELLKECMTQLARFKALCCLYKLCFVGFNAWHCLAAIQQTGIDGDRASIWILDNQLEGIEPDEIWFHEFMRSQHSNVSVDISAEMAVLDQVGPCLPAGWSVQDVQIAVVECEGDLYSALSNVVEACQSNGHRDSDHVGMETAEAVLHGL
eukprot:jgi/Ulvmu1/3177/UM015_0218.1